MSQNPPFSDEDDNKITPPPAPARTPAFPSREDCWSEEATRTLIGAWGSHYLQLNRGNLRQKHWQSVADAVNAAHPKLRRTDVQCKNRVDTVKKKYKIEKSKILRSDGRRESTWPHFQSLDSLIGASFSKPNKKNLRRRASTSPENSPSPEKDSPAPAPATVNRLPVVPWSVPVGPRSKRCASVTERNFSVMAAAAAAMEAEERKYDDDDENEDYDEILVGGKRKRAVVEEEGGRVVGRGRGGYGRLAAAIARLGEIYVKVEEAKQRQMVELEKQRMQFVKDLEIQRMKVFMESQVQIEKIKHNLVNNNGYV